MPLSMARFYAAQVVVCFEYLHAKAVIYRDLKPENVLLASDGCIKLADFGFVKKLNLWERTSTFCGTPEYMAPEILKSIGYSHAVDWYALGILLYELLYGRPPFMGPSPMDVFNMILNEKIIFPKNFDHGAKSLIRHLCEHDLSKRYGHISGGVKIIKNHGFFADFDWNALQNKDLTKIDTGMPATAVNAEDVQQKKGEAEQSMVGQADVPLAQATMDGTERPASQPERRITYKELSEYNDNLRFPPIKVEKDQFLNWF